MAFRRFVLLAALAAFFFLPQHAEAGLVIVRNFTGGSAPGNAAGGGSLGAIFNAAADLWEQAIQDNHVVTINYSWANLGGGTLGVHQLTGQGGVPNRETSANIRFDGDGSSLWFLDSTPQDNSEYTNFTSSSANLGGGVINTGRVFTGATGFAAGRFDLFSVALHEIGHALGLSSANTSYQAEAVDGDVDVVAPRPLPGTTIPLWPGSAHLSINSTLMYPFFGPGTRKLISAADILANAEISEFNRVNLDPQFATVPEPTTMAIWTLAAAVGGLAMRRRRLVV